MSYKMLEHELAYFITWLLEKNESFRNINSDVILEEGHRADIIVEEKRNNEFIPLLIELKTTSNFTEKLLEKLIKQINRYRVNSWDKVVYVICFPGIVSPEDEMILKKNEIEIWDLNFIRTRFKDQILAFPFKKFANRFNFIRDFKNQPQSIRLIKELQIIEAGKRDWLKYQIHIGKILEFLFGDKLSNPIRESSDGPKINRRDFIFRNYAESGFWSYLRNQYKADFIVIDAKNYSGKIKKDEILQITNYIKERGTGLFAIIITRNGEENSSYLTRRDKWISDRKMIIILNDDDIEKMILAKTSSDDAEEILKQRIEEFRLSI